MAAADIGSPGTQNGSISTLGPAGAKFQNGAALCGPDHPVGLGGNQALMVDTQQKIGLNELRLNGRRPDGDDGLSGEHRGSLRDGPYIAGKLEIFQIGQEFLREEIPAPQIGNVLVGEVQPLNVLHDLLQTRRNGKSAAVGTAPEKQVKIGDAILITVGKVSLTHGQLIKIAQHGQVEFVVNGHNIHLILLDYPHYSPWPTTWQALFPAVSGFGRKSALCPRIH